MRKCYFLFFKGNPSVFKNLYIKAALIFVVLLGSSVQQSYAQPGAQWEFSREITLAPATPMDDFQVKIELNGAADHVHMKNDGSDLRFWVGAVECNYWIERFNSTGLSVIWVKVPIAGTGVLTMYYGNPSATTTSNGYTTFDFFDDFDAPLNTSKWAFGYATQSGTSVKVGDNGSGFLTNKSPFLPVEIDLSFFIESKHKEVAYHKIRYYTTTRPPVSISSAGLDTIRRPAFEYGYFSNSKGSSNGYVQWNNTIPNSDILQAGTNYLTQWQIVDGGNYQWKTYNYDVNSSIANKFISVSDKLRFITIVSTSDITSSTSVDWIRVRKSDGSNPDITTDVSTENSHYPLPSITSVNAPSFCEGDVITLTGVGFNSKFLTLNGNVKIGGTSLINPVSNAEGTLITAAIGSGTTGKIKITTIHGDFTTTTTYDVYQKPVLNVGPQMPAICQGETTIPLGGSVGGGATGGTWSVNVAGGTFNSGANDLNTTWTPPAGYPGGTATFTLTAELLTGSNCAPILPVSKELVVNAVPTVTVTWPASFNICEGTPTTISATPGYAGYDFRINGVTKSNSVNNIWTLPSNVETGDIVSVIVSNSLGCSETHTAPSSLTITKIPEDNTSLTISENTGIKPNDSTICLGDAINFSFDKIDYTNDYTNYKYTVDGTSTILYNGTSLGGSTTALLNGQRIKLEVTNGVCTKEFLSEVITVNPLPVAILTSDFTAVCTGKTITFTGNGAGINGTYGFLVNGVTPPNQQGTSPTFSPDFLLNGQTVSVLVTDENKCSSTSVAIPVTIHPLPSQPVISPSGKLEFCEGTTPVTLTATPGASSYQWFRNEAIISGVTGQTYTTANTIPLGSGTYKVKVTNGNSCVSEFSLGVDVVVHSSAVKPTISGSSLEVCVGGSIELTSSIASTYQWYFSSNSGDPLSEVTGQTNQNIILTDVLETGYYAVGITNENGCAGAAFSDRKNVIINTLPDLPEIIITLGKDTLCAGETTTFSAPSSSAYKWFKDGVEINGATSRTYKTVNTLDAAGTYAVMVRNAKSCWSAISAGMVVVVNPLPEPTIDNGNICIGTSGNEYNTEPEMNEYVWTATGGGTITGNGTSSIIVNWANTPGSKSLNVSYRDPVTGCKSTSQATFINLPPIVPVITPSQTENKQVCLGTTVKYSTQTGDGENDYDWTFTGGGTQISGGLANDNFIEITWGEVGPQNVSVNYTKNHCNAPSPTVLEITVNPVPLAGFSYSATPYCSNSGTAVQPSMAAGATRGTFTFSPAGLVINASSGNINTATSTPGTYKVYNTVAAKGGCAIVVDSTEVTITKLPTATISYAGTPFCSDDNTSNTVTLGGVGAYEGGNFTAPAALSIDAGTGAINPSLSTPGIYAVTYTIPASGGCPAVVVTTPNPLRVVITPLPTVSLTYTSNEYCESDSGVKLPSLNGSTGAYTGGTYSVSPAGLNFTFSNGTFKPSGSTPGTYTVTYATKEVGNCASVSKNFEITITAVPTAIISYTGTPFCKTATSVLFDSTGTGAHTGGTFSSTAGLSINFSTGAINPSASTAGTHSVIYTIPSSGGCASVPVTTQVKITDAPTANAGPDIAFCSDVAEIDIVGGVSAPNNNGTLWTTSGDGTFSNAISITNNKYTPGPNDRMTGIVTLTLTATGNDNCAAISDSKTITLNALPPAVNIIPANAEFCEGTIQPLTSVKDAVTPGNTEFKSGIVNIAIPDNNFTGIKNKVTVSGIPANAIINNVSVKFKINHNASKDLIGNLRSPSNKELNLFYMIGNGSNFTNTIISSTASNPIQTFGTSPFTGTFGPQGTIGAMGAAFSNSFSQLYTTATSLNGDWYLKLSDMVLMGGNTGVLNEWSITISYSVPITPVNVIWSPLTDLYTDAAATIPYTGEALATVYTKVSQAGTKTYTATNEPNATNCINSSSVNVIVKGSPLVTIATDYCSDPGRVILNASAIGDGPFTYKWNTGITGTRVVVDEARDYYVSATNSFGCISTQSIAVAKELVRNGDFEKGYVEDDFVTGYTHIDPPGNQTSLKTEGRYAIDTNAINYHDDFFGKDHTTPEQKGNFMIVNGAPGNNRVIWEQTVSVEPNTRYYYSAWAMNLNGRTPFARLRFEVNGQQIGSIADLNIAPKPSNASLVNVNNWVRFYYGLADGTDDSWYSGTATLATIRIINLETATGGNDFGLDDISFATLSPFVRGPLPLGTENQSVCSEIPIQTITYQVGSGVLEPTISGLPQGLVPVFDGVNYKIQGTPINNTNEPITYNYELTIQGCIVTDPPKIFNGKIVVNPNSKLKLTSVPETKDQNLCIGLPMAAITIGTSGQISNINYENLPTGISSIWNGGQVTLSGTPTASGTFNYKIITKGGSCSLDTLKGVISVSPKSKAGLLNSPTICIGGSGTVDLNTASQIGNVTTWQISNDGLNFTDIANSANTLSQSFSNVNQSTYYRVQVKNDFCPELAPSNIGKVKISNLWDGGLDKNWSNFINWSAGSLPTMTDCSNTVTIPQVPVNKNDPTINELGGGNAQVINLNILTGGHLTVNGGNLQVKGVISNNGILDAKMGGVEYNGSVPQEISPGIFLNNAIGDLKISNSDKGLTLNSPVDIYRSVTFGAASGKLITNDQLTFKSTREETAWLGNMTGKTIIGKATVERFINTGPNGHGKSWQMLAIPTIGQSIRDSWQEGAISTGKVPIHNQTVGYGTLLTTGYNNVPANGFDLYTAPGPSIKTFDPIIGNFDKGPLNTDLPIYNEKGYQVLVRGDRTVYTSNGAPTPTVLRTKGTLLTGDQPKRNFLPNTWNSVGNPYASAIDYKLVDKTGSVEDIIAVWDPMLGDGVNNLGGWIYLAGNNTVVPVSPRYPDGQVHYIQSGQAFMVQTAGSVGSIQIKESAKVSGSTMVMRGQREESRRTQLRSNLYTLNNAGNSFITDGILLQFGDNLSSGIDGKDARKMGNSNESLSIRSNGILLSIERRQSVNSSDTIFLNLSGVRVQNYRFEFIAEGLESEGMQGYLEDIYLGKLSPLNLEGKTTIDFNIENKSGSYASNRFRIVFKSSLGSLPVTFVGINAAQVKEHVLVSWNVENEINIIGYDVEKSTDGLTFTKIGHLPAKNIKSYNWLDEQVPSGKYYYRIKVIEEIGKTELSSVVKVLIANEPSKITVYPNPIINGVVNVHLINQPTGKYKIRLLNPVGQVIVNKIVNHDIGNSIHPIDWDYKLTRGIYQIEVTKPDGGVNLIKVVY